MFFDRFIFWRSFVKFITYTHRMKIVMEVNASIRTYVPVTDERRGSESVPKMSINTCVVFLLFLREGAGYRVGLNLAVSDSRVCARLRSLQRYLYRLSCPGYGCLATFHSNTLFERVARPSATRMRSSKVSETYILIFIDAATVSEP